ncbi:hypothetical protein NON00_23490, partial [Roseomonas sp. GC11]|uniref:hypothetical protein n=1 Tax=Roseomonas sp. GC11 TaxID=2950546 RepID=UPI00210A5312
APPAPAAALAAAPAGPPAPLGAAAETLMAYPCIAWVLRHQLASAVSRSEAVTYELHERLTLIDAMAPALEGAAGGGQGGAAGGSQQAGALRGLVLEALATLQFQDILRQQLGQAGSALEELAAHATALAEHLRDPEGHPAPPPPEALLRRMQESYVMEAQRAAHRGGDARAAPPPPDIELF